MVARFQVGVAMVAASLVAGGPPDQARLPWWERAQAQQVGRYWIKTDLPAGRVNDLARHLNLMHTEYVRYVSVPRRAPAPLDVLIFEDRNEYLNTLRWRYGVDAAGSGGMFFANASGQALAVWTGDRSTRRVLAALRHEGFHQFAFSRFGTDLPLWVNEGLAELFGESVAVGGHLRIGSAPARKLEPLQGAIETQSHLGFGDMLTMTREQWDDAVKDGRAADLYRQSWSMVRFLIDGHAPQFDRYLKLVNEGYPPEVSFARAFETDDPAAFEKQWMRYVLALRPDPFATALDRIEFLAAGALALSEEGVRPSSLDELREALQASGFLHTLSRHETQVELHADDATFVIPRDGDEAPAVFVVAPPRPSHRAGPRAPSSIRTEGLGPRELVVRWVFDEEAESWTYDIDFE